MTRRRAEFVAAFILILIIIIATGISLWAFGMIEYPTLDERLVSRREYVATFFQNLTTEVIGVLVIFGVYKVILGLWDDEEREVTKQATIITSQPISSSVDSEPWKEPLKEALHALILAGKLDRQSLRAFGNPLASGIELLTQEEIRQLQRAADSQSKP